MVAPVDQTTRMYCSVADVTTRIDLQTLPNVNLEHLIRAVTQRIEEETNRVFVAVGPEVRHFLGGGKETLFVDDLLAFTAISVDDVAQDLTDLLAMPSGKLPTRYLLWRYGTLWTERADVAITGTWGYAEQVPWPIWDACVMLTVRALERAKIAYQDASAIPEMGQLVYAKAMPVEVREVLNRFRRVA
jgi:hypothetical protein